MQINSNIIVIVTCIAILSVVEKLHTSFFSQLTHKMHPDIFIMHSSMMTKMYYKPSQ